MLVCFQMEAKAIDIPTIVNAGIAEDKQHHFITGAGLTLAVSEVTDNNWIGLGVGISAGIAKEVYDNQHRGTHTSDVYDVLATSAGSILIFGIRELIGI